MRIIHPIFLLLIPAAAVILYLLARRPSAYRPWIHFPLRLLIVSAIALAMAGTEMRRPDYSQERIFLLDVSDSTGLDTAAALDQIASLARRMDRRDRVAVIAFGRDPAIESEPSSPQSFLLKQIRSTVSTSSTDIEAALAAARSLHQNSASGRSSAQIILISDGNETRGSVQREILRLAADRLPVYCVPIERGGPDFRVQLIDSPQSVRSGDLFSVTAEVTGTGRVTIAARTDDPSADAAPEDTIAVAGRKLWRAELSLKKPGLHRIEIVISSPEDSYPQNNAAAAAVWVNGPASLLWVANGDVPLAAAARNSGYAVTLAAPSQVPASLAELQAYDAVVIEDCPKWTLSKQVTDSLKSYVQTIGGGLIMLGGANAFGPGGYIGSPIEEILPVKCDPEEQTSKPISLAVVIDRSGSMDEKVANRSKLSFAQEGVALVLDQLKEQDRIAVIAFNGAAEVVHPLGKVAQKDDLKKRVFACNAFGTTDINAALDAALKQLASADDASPRHTIILSDGLSNSPEAVDAAAWARKFAEKKISVSVVATGEQANRKLLLALAEGSGGRFYSVENIEKIPDIFVTEARPSAGKLLKRTEGGFATRLLASPLTRSLGDPPRVPAYVLVKAKDSAETAIEVDNANALLATWRSGAGRSAAFAAPAGAIAGWKDAGPLWAAVIAWTARPAGDPSLTTTLKAGKGSVHVEVAATGGIKDYLANVVDPSGKASTVRLQQAAPGLYVGDFAAADPGVYPVAIVENSQNGMILRERAAAVVRYSSEWDNTRANADLLAEISKATGGKVIRNLGELPPPSGGSDAFANVAWAAAILAIIIFLIELAIP